MISRMLCKKHVLPNLRRTIRSLSNNSCSDNRFTCYLNGMSIGTIIITPSLVEISWFMVDIVREKINKTVIINYLMYGCTLNNYFYSMLIKMKP